MQGPVHLVQLTHPDEGRRAALVYGGELHLLATYRSIYDFARAALETGWKLRDLLSADLSGIVLDYSEIHELGTPWRFLPAFDQPREPGRCLVSGLASEGPAATWQYQGSGDCLYGHGEPLPVSSVSAAVRIPELAAAYVIGEGGVPRRLGVAAGIRGPRHSALGPELMLETESPYVEGAARLLRGRDVIWSREFATEVPLMHALAAVEVDHFRHADHRRPGDTHIHFFGAKLFVTSDALVAGDGDEAIVELKGFGRALRSTVLAEQPAPVPVEALPL